MIQIRGFRDAPHCGDAPDPAFVRWAPGRGTIRLRPATHPAAGKETRMRGWGQDKGGSVPAWGGARLRTRGLAACLFLAACSDPAAVAAPDPMDPTPPDRTPPEYVVAPPEGTLPWPQHDPAWNLAQYDSMLTDLWVVNNFGQYQGSPDGRVLYLHDALDVVLPNGTPVHSIVPGTVVASMGSSEFYRTLIVEDADRPGFGWGYTHIYDFEVAVGDTVHQGTKLGRVNFLGLPHVHLTRMKLRPGTEWNDFDNVLAKHPDAYFAFADTEPPAFEPGGFRYVRHGTDSAFVASEPGGMVTVSGNVSIVVGLRDPGEWTMSTPTVDQPAGFGNRHSVTRVEYEIEGPEGVAFSAVAFDLSTMYLPLSGLEQRQRALTLYQMYHAVDPPAPNPGHYNARFSFYVITNSDGRESDGFRELDPADREHAWRTVALDRDGAPAFPNGVYRITVTAFDSRGNASHRSETVRVQN